MAEFDAFISYSHSADARLAPALQTALHRFAKPWWKMRAIRVFRDETNLAVDPDLAGKLFETLEASKFFILLASPAAANSKWVAMEAEAFLKRQQPDRFLIVVTDGKVVWDDDASDFDWSQTDALPDTLSGAFATHPLYLDLSWIRDARWTEESEDLARDPRFQDSIARLSATIRGLSLDQIAGEDVRQHRKTLRAARIAIASISVLACVAVAGAVYAWKQSIVAEGERKSALQSESLALARLAGAYVNDGHAEGGIRLSLKALPENRKDPSRPYVNAAEAALYVSVTALRQSRMIGGHKGRIYAIAASPDGHRVASGGQDKFLRLWDTETLKLVWESPGHTAAIGSIAFSPDGKLIATTSRDKTVRLWNAATGAQVAQLPDHNDVGYAVAFSANGRLLASASADGKIRLWDMATRKFLRALVGHTGNVLAVTFSPDGTRIASSGKDKLVRIWETESGRLLKELPGHSDRIYTLAFNPDGTRLASGARDKTIRVWDSADWLPLRVLEGHSHWVYSVRFDQTGRRLVSSSRDGSVRIWDTRRWTIVATLRGHDAPIRSSEFVPGAQLIVSSGYDGSVRLWRADHPSALEVMSFPDQSVPWAAAGPEGVIAVALNPRKGEGDRFVAVIRRFGAAGTGPELGGHTGLMTGVAYSSTGKVIATASEDRKIILWDAKTGARLRPLTGHTDRVHSVTFSPDGRTLVSASEDMTARVWRVADGEELHVLKKHTEGVLQARFSRDGKRIVTASKDHTVRIWDAANGTAAGKPFRHDDWVYAAAFSADGRYLATGSDDGTARVWDAATGRMLEKLPHGRAWVFDVAFHPDGRRLATAADDGIARVWEWRDKSVVAELSGHTGWVTAVSFIRGGTRILTSSLDGTVRSWPYYARLGELIDDARRRIGLTPVGKLASE